MSEVPGPAALAGRRSVSQVPIPSRLGHRTGPVPLRRLWLPDLGVEWHDLPGHQAAAAVVVPRDVARHEPEVGSTS